MFTRLELIERLLISQGDEIPKSIKHTFTMRFLKMSEYFFMDEFKEETGLNLNRIIKNRYFIS